MDKPPTTRKQAEATEYCGIAYRSDWCAYQVSVEWSSDQCGRKPGLGPAKLYCWQHAKMIARDRKETTMDRLVATDPPKEKDADKMGCVMFRDANGLNCWNIAIIEHASAYTHWRKCPPITKEDPNETS